MAMQLWVEGQRVTLDELIECVPSSPAAKEVARLRAELAEARADRNQWKFLANQLQVLVESNKQSADLLARVRAVCRVSLTNNGFLRLHIDADDKNSDLLRELAEVLTHETGRSVPVLGERP